MAGPLRVGPHEPIRTTAGAGKLARVRTRIATGLALVLIATTIYIASLRQDAQGALEYLQALPRSERGYRTFCAWSLMMGAVAVANLDQPRRSRRDETAELLARTAAIAQDNAALGRLFAELLPELPVVAPGPPQDKPESVEWFRAVLAAPLSDAELRRLGIAVRASALAG